MNLLLLLGIAVSLAMDASAVGIGTSIKLKKVSWQQNLRMSLAFGFFQFLMPVLGCLAGRTVEFYIRAADHWLAFGLLAGVGGHMIWEAFGKEEADGNAQDPTRGWKLLVLSIATSIDALVVGISLAFLKIPVWQPAVVIGVVTFALTALAMQLGARLGSVFGKRMDIFGGLVLIAIGVKILVEHLKS